MNYKLAVHEGLYIKKDWVEKLIVISFTPCGSAILINQAAILVIQI